MAKNKKSSREIIHDAILNKIQYCEWPPGTLISEPKLTEVFGFSRTPIREALFLLAQEGFVDIIPQSGSYVSKIRLKRIQEILYLRYHLELPVLEEMTLKHIPIPDSVGKLLDQMRVTAADEDWRETVNLDYEIHAELMKAAGHEHIWNCIKSELPHYTRFRFFEPYHAEFKGPEPRSISEHCLILDSIQKGDLEGLRTIMRSHYDYTLILRKSYNIDRINRHPDYFESTQNFHNFVGD